MSIKNILKKDVEWFCAPLGALAGALAIPFALWNYMWTDYVAYSAGLMLALWGLFFLSVLPRLYFRSLRFKKTEMILGALVLTSAALFLVLLLIRTLGEKLGIL